MKDSLQFRRTTRDIVNAFFHLLEHEEFSKITVKEIMDVAMISRSTFYQHFSDKYDIVEKVEESYLDEFLALLKKAIISPKFIPLNKKYQTINSIVAPFFVGKNKELNLLLDLDEVHLNFEVKLRETMLKFIRDRATKLSYLSARILSAEVSEYFIFYIRNPKEIEKFASQLYLDDIDVTLTSFGIEITEQNRKILKQAIQKLLEE